MGRLRVSYETIDPSNPPVAVIAGKLNGKHFGIALHTRYSGLAWAKKDSVGYNTKFEGIICNKQGSETAGTATFTGDTDGSDSWEYIKQHDSAGAVDAATNYPAFQWVNTYNTTYADKLGGKIFNWYMPSLAELCEIYKNREIINRSLTKIHGHDPNYADASLGTGLYWSSPHYYGAHFVSNVAFSNGRVAIGSKDIDNRVCCIAVF